VLTLHIRTSEPERRKDKENGSSIANHLAIRMTRSRKIPPKVLQKARDFPFFNDYVYDKGNRLMVMGY